MTTGLIHRRGLLLRALRAALYMGIALLAVVLFHVVVIGAFTMLHLLMAR